MTEQEAIAQEAAWEAEADALRRELQAIDEPYKAQLEGLRERLEAVETDIEDTEAAQSLAQGDRPRRIGRLWDRIYESREARGLDVPTAWRVGRFIAFLDPDAGRTPMLDLLKRSGNRPTRGERTDD